MNMNLTKERDSFDHQVI